MLKHAQMSRNESDDKLLKYKDQIDIVSENIPSQKHKKSKPKFKLPDYILKAKKDGLTLEDILIHGKTS